MKKIKEYCKQNKSYLIVMLIGIILFMIQMQYVELYADDLFLANIGKGGMAAAIEHLQFNYMNWGGGPTPFFVILLLFLPLNVWKILNAVMVVVTIALVIRMIVATLKGNKTILAIVLWICVLALNIYISDQTLYWLDGNIAYVLTAFQLFLYFYYLYSRLVMKTKMKRYDMVLLPFVAFFSGWTGPQAGALTVIFSILFFIWVKCMRKESIKPTVYVAMAFGILGFLVYYLAPGNNARMQEGFLEFAQYNLFEKIAYRMDSVWNLLFHYRTYQFASIPFYLYVVMGLSCMIAIRYTGQETKQWIRRGVKLLSIWILVFLLFNFAISIGYHYNGKLTGLLFTFEPILEHLQNGTFRLSFCIPYIITTGVMISLVILTYYISHKKQNPFLAMVVIGALLGQGMMVLSPYSPLRTTFISVYLLWMAIAMLVAIVMKERIPFFAVMVMIVATTLEFNFGVIMLVAYFVFYMAQIVQGQEKSWVIQGVILLSMLGIVTLLSYLQMIEGYRINQQIYQENLRLIQEFKEKENHGNVLYLKQPADPKYGFTSFVGIDWVEVEVKKYFELEESVTIEELKP